MLPDILRSAFAAAHERIGLVFFDLLWKVLWIVLSLVVLLLTVVWISSSLQAFEWEDTGVPVLNGLIATLLLREFWEANRRDIFFLLSAFALVSAAMGAWLEAFFRRRIVRDLATLSPREREHPFNIFLISGVTKNVLLFTSALLLLAVLLAGAPVIAIVGFIALGFFLTLLDTLIRADAVDLLGTDLIRVAGLLGILMSFESLIATSLVAILLTGLLNVAGQGEAIAMFAAVAAALVFLSFLHSYLLLVRFSAVAIMRRNVVEV
jgi:hypothetical protein